MLLSLIHVTYHVKIIMGLIGSWVSQMSCCLSLMVLYSLPAPTFQLEEANLGMIFPNGCTNGGVQQLSAAHEGADMDAASTRVRKS